MSVARQAAAPGLVVDQQADGQGHDKGRQEAPCEERPDGDLPHAAQNHHGHAGRHQDPHAGRRGDDGGRIPVVVAGFTHGGDEDSAHGRGVGDGGARDAREDHLRSHRSHAERAADRADDGKRQIDDAPRDPAGLHQEPREDEKRHGHEGEEIHAGVHALHDQYQRDVAFQQEREGGEPQREGDGDAHQEGGDQDDGKHSHQECPFGLSRCASGANEGVGSFGEVVEHDEAAPRDGRVGVAHGQIEVSGGLGVGVAHETDAFPDHEEKEQGRPRRYHQAQDVLRVLREHA